LVRQRNVKRFTKRYIAYGVLATAISVTAWLYVQNHTNEARVTRQLQSQSQELDKKIKETELKTQNIEQLNQIKQDLEKQKADLEKQLQAKLQQKQKVAVAYAATPVKPVKPTAPPKPSITIANCGDNEYANYIYMKESGCRTTALNPIGCYGIGQSCPASKIAHCGSDYTCQNAWFSNYAITRYGSWEKAYQFWLGNKWW